MNTTYRTTALELMMGCMPRVRALVTSIAIHDRNLAQQAKRAATSVVSNHAEADGVQGGHRRERVHTALGSLQELRAQLKVAAAWGYVASADVQAIDRDLDQVAAMTWRRLHPKR